MRPPLVLNSRLSCDSSYCALSLASPPVHSSVQVDGQVNRKLQSVHIEAFPIETAHFTRDGTEVVMIGNDRSFVVYDMMAGKITRMNIRGERRKEECFEGVCRKMQVLKCAFTHQVVMRSTF